MTNNRTISFTIHATPQDNRGSWQGELLDIRTGESRSIASSFELAQHVQNEIDGLRQPDNTAWTRIIEQASRASARNSLENVA